MQSGRSHIWSITSQLNISLSNLYGRSKTMKIRPSKMIKSVLGWAKTQELWETNQSQSITCQGHSPCIVWMISMHRITSHSKLHSFSSPRTMWYTKVSSGFRSQRASISISLWRAKALSINKLRRNDCFIVFKLSNRDNFRFCVQTDIDSNGSLLFIYCFISFNEVFGRVGDLIVFLGFWVILDRRDRTWVEQRSAGPDLCRNKKYIVMIN